MTLLLALTLLSAGAEDVAAMRRALPTTLAGIRRRDDPHISADSALEVYEGATAADPLVVVAISPINTSVDRSVRRAVARSQPISVGLRRTLFEGRFTVPGKPSAATFFGEYLTERGLVQAWVIEDAGMRTLVSTTVLRMSDRRRMFDAVRRDLLGGAYMIEDSPTTPAKAEANQ